jgi:hypothetical protein
LSSAQSDDALEREIRHARIEIARLRGVAARADERRREAELLLEAAREQNHRYIGQIVALRNTISWKLTRPIRAVRQSHFSITRR